MEEDLHRCPALDLHSGAEFETRQGACNAWGDQYDKAIRITTQQAGPGLRGRWVSRGLLECAARCG